MKVRNGFVSNSSSSSFVVVGILIDKDSPARTDFIKAVMGGKELDKVATNSFGKTFDEIEKYAQKDILEDMSYDVGDKGYELLEGEDDGVPEGKTLIGKPIIDVSSDGDQLDFDEIDLSSIEADLTDKGVLGPFKIFYGTRCS